MSESKEFPHNLIGGEFCKARLDPKLLPQEGQELTPHEREVLWLIFQQIGICWDDLYSKARDSSNLRSSWLEFIDAKTKHEPTYIGEYSNAVSVVEELLEIYGEAEDVAARRTERPLVTFQKLFFENNIPQEDPPKPPTTRLEHAKRYVVDEFIRVNLVASGFKSFGRPGNTGENYKGYIGGTRYNLKAPVRSYEEKE